MPIGKFSLTSKRLDITLTLYSGEPLKEGDFLHDVDRDHQYQVGPENQITSVDEDLALGKIKANKFKEVQELDHTAALKK